MDLTSVTAVHAGRQLPPWRPGDAWLAGGTWLFSEPQPAVQRLVDLTALGWPALVIGPDGLELAATCTVAQLEAMQAPPHWAGGELIRQCCLAFLASFKICNVATVGGNLCTALPAGPMISLAVALQGTCTIWSAAGSPRQVPAADFVVGPGVTVLAPGELLRSIHLPTAALRSTAAFRKASLRSGGRSAALLIGRRDADRTVLTVTASTRRPVVIDCAGVPDAAQLRAAIEDAVPPELYLDDPHGDPDWRQHLTLRLAEEIRAELAAGRRRPRAPQRPGAIRR
jgi:CO/xanthine dehydrogenase FAD-binding subunit